MYIIFFRGRDRKRAMAIYFITEKLLFVCILCRFILLRFLVVQIISFVVFITNHCFGRVCKRVTLKIMYTYLLHAHVTYWRFVRATKIFCVRKLACHFICLLTCSSKYVDNLLYEGFKKTTFDYLTFLFLTI